jgi:hypothetical protein
MALTLQRTLAAALILSAGAVAPLAAQVSVGGVVYAQYQYQLATDTLKADSSLPHINNFDVTRAYINVTGRFAGGLGTRVTADIFNGGTAASAHSYRIKYAFVTWTPEGSPLTYKIGEMHTPWLDWEEALWDFRMQGQMAMERGGYMSASDFGAGVDGKWNSDAFNFQAGIYNGNNYSGAPTDGHKDFMARASYRLLATDDGSRVGGLRVTGYVGIGKPLSGGTRNRFIGMVSYRSMDLTLAAEFSATEDTTIGGNTTIGGGAVAGAPRKKGTVISAYGVAHLPQTRWSVMGRVDITNPNTSPVGTGPSDSLRNVANTPKTTRIIAGLVYQLNPNLRLLADVDLLSYESAYSLTTGTPAQQLARYQAYANRQSAYFHAMFNF